MAYTNSAAASLPSCPMCGEKTPAFASFNGYRLGTHKDAKGAECPSSGLWVTARALENAGGAK